MAGIAGCAMPLSSILMARILNTFLINGEDFREAANLGAILFLACALASFISTFLQTYLLSVVGNNLVYRLRTQIFERILTMHIGFFDNPANSAGTLTSALSMDTLLVKNLTSTVVGSQFQSAACLICGLCIALYSSWQITLVTINIDPFRYSSN